MMPGPRPPDKGTGAHPVTQYQSELARRLAGGNYQIDAEAIAEAIIRRSRTDWFLGSRLTEMLESGEADRVPRSIEKQRSRARPDDA